ncbi:MAG TPA: hypothetical protein VFE32_11805 [Puia sp.]|jgi:hypothetical protein|nr:hypothetical protein [Puia sp.]
MELDKLHQKWNSFPEVSLEERPVLSSDLEKMVVSNPLSDAFYLQRRLVARIIAFALLWLADGWLLRAQWLGDRKDIYLYAAFFLLLSYALFFHLRLLLFADYPTLLGLPLVPFLGKLEIILDKYIASFKLVSAILAFTVLVFFEQWMNRANPALFDTFLQRDWSKWLLLVFLIISFDILLIHTFIPRYRKLVETVRKYRHGIVAAKARNEIWTIK